MKTVGDFIAFVLLIMIVMLITFSMDHKSNYKKKSYRLGNHNPSVEITIPSAK